MAVNGEILEIFSWFPAESVFKFSSVSKMCNEFPSDRFFAKKQQRNMLSKPDFGFFIQPNSCQRYADKLEFYSFLCKKKSFGLPQKSLEFMKSTGRLLASSNGVICCRNIGNNSIVDQLFVVNPATQNWLAIPSPTNSRDANKNLQIFFQCNIGLYDEFPHDYMLIVMERAEDWSSSGLLCKTYVPQKGMWQETGYINGGSRNLLFESPAYHDGSVYFLSDWFPYFGKGSPFYWPYIVMFDPKKAKSSFLKVPKGVRKGLVDSKMGIFKFGKGKSTICLVQLTKGVFNVWGLNDGNLGSWSRILKIRVRAMGMVEPNSTVAGFSVFNGDSLLVATEQRVYRYDLTDDWGKRRAKEICEHECGDNVLLNSYSSTLRPCGDREMRLPT